MKLAFSTLACPNYTWQEICAMAKDTGFDGVEIRGLGRDLFAFDLALGTETTQALQKTLLPLRELGLSVPCVSSHCALKFADKEAENHASLLEYIRLSGNIGAQYIRILGDRHPWQEGEVDDELVARQLTKLVPAANAANITLLVETNGVYSDTARLARLLGSVASDNVAALWDVHHTCRFGGETPEDTVQHLGTYIKYVHIKDSILAPDKTIIYRLMGEGDLPIDEAMKALASINYDGYISLEWVKKWSEDLEDAGIVIPHFAHYMSRYVSGKPAVTPLFCNKSGTGQFIWEKEKLIDATFGEMLDRVTEEFPEQTAFRYTTQDYTRTYREFRNEVDTFARALIALGVKKGDKVAIWATNVPEWFITFWAAVRIGAVLVTVNTAYKIHEAEYLFRQSDTHTLVLIEGHKDARYAEIIAELCPELTALKPGEPLHSRKLPFLRNVITAGYTQAGCLTFEQALEKADSVPAAALYQRAAMINRHDVVNMQYTSGTTGFPKGVMLTHYNVVNNGKNIGDRMDLSTADRFMIHVPMFHCFGMVLSMTACMTHGSTMSPIPAFSPRLSLECINKEKITAFNGVPTMFIAMMEHADFADTDFSHMRTGIMAGSPCPVKVMRDVIDKMRMTDITIVFGQTESSPGCTMSTADDDIEVKVNTVGRPLPGTECRIVDPETNAELPDDADGEFVARGYNIMRGYYKMPAATAAAIDADGWLHTGDLARRSPDGNYKITGRIKDMIIRGGENIYPKEIEDFLYTHEKVGDVQVVGVPDKQYGEEICAWIILKSGEIASEEEIKAYVRARMAKHKTPRYVLFVDEFPMNAAGKIMKYKMVEATVSQLQLTMDN